MFRFIGKEIVFLILTMSYSICDFRMIYRPLYFVRVRTVYFFDVEEYLLLYQIIYPILEFVNNLSERFLRGGNS